VQDHSCDYSGTSLSDALANIGRISPPIPQHDILRYCQKNVIVMQVYAPPNAITPLLEDDENKSIANIHDVNVYDILLSWQRKLSLF
jgi:diketogulonate reductase-like aldo/keto reductase